MENGKQRGLGEMEQDGKDFIGTSRRAGHVARMGEGRKVYRVLVGKPEGKRPLGRPRRRWEVGVKMDLREIGWGVWSGFTWLRLGIFGGLL
jgi:hypothetical protein